MKERPGAGVLDRRLSVVDRASAAESLNVYKVSYIFGQERSDYKNFVNHMIPTVFFTDATGGCYHTTGDDLSIVNFTKLRAQAKTAFRVVVELAEAPDRLAFSPKNPAGATYADAVSLDRVFSSAQGDLPLFKPADQVSLQAMSVRAAQIALDGPALFETDDAFTLLGDASQAIAILAASGCRRF